MGNTIRRNYIEATGVVIKFCSKCKIHLRKGENCYCGECLNQNTYKYREQFKGIYIYYIYQKSINKIIKIGECLNMYIRKTSHIDTKLKTEVSRYITQNNFSKDDFEVHVLDMTKEFKEMEWGTDERKILEADMIENHINTVKNHMLLGTNKKRLSEYDRNTTLEEIYRVIDTNKFIEYKQWLEAKK